MFLFALHASTNAISQVKYPLAVEKVLKLTPKNRHELEKVMAHYQKTGETLKLKAAYFLISNMDIHSSYDIIWVDVNNQKIPFNELDYPDMEKATVAFEKLKKQFKGVHPKQIIYRDIDKITANYLINNIDKAFMAWKSPYAKNLNFSDFCEYLLPYRISVEPLQNWRGRYQNEFKDFLNGEKGKPLESLLTDLAIKRPNLFYNSFGDEQVRRKEPLPRLGALNLLLRKNGLCEDMAGLAVFSLRAMGIASSIDYVPYWATSAYSHFFNVAFKPNKTVVPFEMGNANNPLQVIPLRREPSKVIRTTYSKQTGTLASFTALEEIPSGFLRSQNYLDVTSTYWETADLPVRLQPGIPNCKIVYACVFNKGQFKATWWAKVSAGIANFEKMPKGVVYLPMVYQNKKTVVCGNPVALGYHNRLELNADLSKPRSIIVKQQDNYLLFKPGKKYRLYYWKNGWKLIATQTAMANEGQLIFTNVPNNALLILIPEYSQRKERPFIITNKGERVWF